MEEYFRENEKKEIGADMMEILSQFNIDVQDPKNFDEVRDKINE